LRFVNEQDRAKQRLVDMLLPLGAYGLVRAPAIRCRDREAKQVAELAIEVGHAALRPFDFADDDVAQGGEPLGEPRSWWPHAWQAHSSSPAGIVSLRWRREARRADSAGDASGDRRRSGPNRHGRWSVGGAIIEVHEVEVRRALFDDP
jgi:hypothetical protein